jgi:hypothetical protein
MASPISSAEGKAVVTNGAAATRLAKLFWLLACAARVGLLDRLGSPSVSLEGRGVCDGEDEDEGEEEVWSSSFPPPCTLSEIFPPGKSSPLVVMAVGGVAASDL